MEGKITMGPGEARGAQHNTPPALEGRTRMSYKPGQKDADYASETALRILAGGLALLLLLGSAACQDDVPNTTASATLATPTASSVAQAGVDPASSPQEMEVSDSAMSETTEVAAVTLPVSYAVAEAAYHDGRFSEAVDLFEGYVATKPENPWGYYMLGLSAWKSGRLDLAEVNLRESVTMDPNHVKGHVNLARVLLAQGRSEDALEHAVIAEDIDPASTQAKRVLARTQAESGRIEDALATYESILYTDNEDVWSLNNMGYLLVQAGRFEDAMGPLALATTLEPENVTFQNNLGHALEGAGHMGAALTAFQSILQVEPGHEGAGETVARLEPLSDEDEEMIDVVAVGETFRDRVRGTLAFDETVIPATDSIPRQR